ncbi:hypothetical protein POM88_047679 [Heracleum sosnowskyi]|uniref:Uncharacterized protein n=1 Tax=Heracleum sosnowskyi TaxID=360622 RepID=A0AAD8LZU6_9APIA|nr:hypothetical protein POM88_047679 [Heracleum sosnowskyi]
MNHDEDSSGTGSKMELKSTDNNARFGKLSLEGSSRTSTLLELPRDHGFSKIYRLIKCDSNEHALEALRSLELLSDQPRSYFVPWRFGCVVDGNAYVVVDKVKCDSFPVPKDKRRTAVRHMIELLIHLELNGLVHAHLETWKLVNDGGIPIFCSIPVQFENYKTFRTNVDEQHNQICQAIDFIVGEEAAADDDYKKFREELLKSRTVVDMHSLLFHPYVTSKKDLPFYYASCGLDLCYTDLDHASNFSEKFNDRDWKGIVTASGSKSMVVMLESMVVYGVPRLYQNTAFDKHQFIWHVFSEDHDEQVKFESFFTMVEHVKNIFPEYVDEMWKYMHDYGLNAHFGPKDYGFKLLEYAKAIMKKENDTNICIDSLLKACKMCCWMLGKFHTFCEMGEIVSAAAYYVEELKFAATELEYCIKGLESSNRENYDCANLKSRIKKKEMCDFDKVILASVRCICFGLNVHLQVIKKSPTGETITEAIKSTNEDLKEFYNSDLTIEQLMHLHTPDKWPTIDYVCRIVGRNFILSSKDFTSLAEELRGVIVHLINMLGN